MKRNLLIFGLCLLAFIPLASVEAQNQTLTYESMVRFPDVPGFGDGDVTSTEDLVRILYGLSITIAGLLAVFKIIYGGVQYMLTDVVTSKEQAKKDIWGAIFGLVIVLSAVFILDIINPQLTRIEVFQQGPSVGIQRAQPQSDVQTTQPPPTPPPGSSAGQALQQRDPNDIIPQTVNPGAVITLDTRASNYSQLEQLWEQRCQTGQGTPYVPPIGRGTSVQLQCN